MLTFWFVLFGLPLTAFGVWAVLCPACAGRALVRFPRHAGAGIALTALAWAGTAYEVDAIGIDIFDRIVRRLWFLPFEIPGGVWILAAVLTVLTCLWMANLLPIRALAALCMLFPAELFPSIRLCPTAGRLTLVVFAYVCAIAGMFAMFYPWRIRQVWAYLAERENRVRAYGAVHAAWGALFLVQGLCSAMGLLG